MSSTQSRDTSPGQICAQFFSADARPGVSFASATANFCWHLACRKRSREAASESHPRNQPWFACEVSEPRSGEKTPLRSRIQRFHPTRPKDPIRKRCGRPVQQTTPTRIRDCEVARKRGPAKPRSWPLERSKAFAPAAILFPRPPAKRLSRATVDRAAPGWRPKSRSEKRVVDDPAGGRN